MKAISKVWLSTLIIVILILGTLFRFINLDRKPYWRDEVITSTVISGYTDKEIFEKFSDGHLFNKGDILKYKFPNPEKNWGDALKLANLNSHPPLFYLAARLWVQHFGNSIAVIRSLSAVISLLSLPCIYWLSLELFKSPLTGWFGMVLMSVSPFHVIYAQEARSYSLLTFAILLSSASLLSSLRLKSKFAWLAYVVALAIGLYTHLFFILVIIGYGIYVAILEGFRLSRTFVMFLLSSLLAFLAFMPRIIFYILNYSIFLEDSAWIKELYISFLEGIRLWIENISLVFCDLTWLAPYLHLGKYSLFILSFPFFALVVYAMYFLYTSTPKQAYLFVFSLIGSTAFSLMLADLLLGGVRQTIPRYIIPCYLGIQLAVSHLLAVKTTSISVSSQRTSLWQMATALLVTSGVISCTIISQAQTWTNKLNGEKIIELSSIINHANRPLLIYNIESDSTTDKRLLEVGIPLIYQLNPDVQIQFITERKTFSIPHNNRSIFLFTPTEKLSYELRQKNYTLRVVKAYPSSRTSKGVELWQVNKIN